MPTELEDDVGEHLGPLAMNLAQQQGANVGAAGLMLL